MLTYISRRLLLAVPLLLAVVTLLFVLVELSPGNAADKYFNPDTPPEVRAVIFEKFGLDQPAHVRYWRMLRQIVFEQDFGRSLNEERPVSAIIKDRVPNSILLAVVTLSFVFVFGVIFGTIQAVRQYSVLDNVLSVVSLFFYSMPSFWLALMLLLVFTLYWPILPSSGMKDLVMHDYMSPAQKVKDYVLHLVLPGGALGIVYAASIARYMRSSLLEVLGQDFIRTARAKGLSGRTVILKHAMRNALIPVVTLIGLSLPALFSGSVVVEMIFSWPGMGRLILESIFLQDLPVLTACFFIFAVLVVIGNLIADLFLTVADPRIRFS